jgi:hypothetical protein
MSLTVAGDRLRLKAGTYTTRIDYSTLTINSGTDYTTGAVTIYSEDGIGAAIIRPTGDNTAINLNNAASPIHHVIFDGLTADCTNLNGSGAACVSVGGGHTGAHHIRFIRFESKNSGASGSPDNPIGPGFLIGGDDNETIDCSSHHNGFGSTVQSGSNGVYGYYVTGSRNVVRNCDIHHNGAYGIHSFNTSFGTNDNIYENNRIWDNGANQTQHTYNLLMTAGSGNIARNNVIWATSSSGPVFGLSLGSDGGNCQNCVAYNNTVVGVPYYGIKVSNTTVGAVVRNNIAHNNALGNLDNEAGGNATFSNNLCTTTCPSYSTNSKAEPATTTFVNLATQDFRLKAGSQAISGGTPVPVTTDITGLLRPAGGGWDIGAYEYTADIPASQPPQLVVALPLDEGTGTIASDVSGQKNNANFVGGVTWDNAGKYGKAVALDGTGYLNIPASTSMAIAPAMTLEAWIYPTASPSGFSAIIVQDRYYLYASSDAGVCPTPLAPIGGYSTTVGHYLCATSLPPQGQWSYLTVTHDGTTTTFYLNGNVIASQISTDPMIPTTYPMTIGASSFGEYFIGKIDEPRVYTYARNPAQILSDMNTPLIGPPGKLVEIAAPASVEISSASSLEISAQ